MKEDGGDKGKERETSGGREKEARERKKTHTKKDIAPSIQKVELRY